MPLPEADAATRAYFVGWLERFAGYVRDVDYAAARPLYEESLSISRESDDRRGVAQALNGLGIMACDQGDYHSARSFHEQSLTIRRELGTGSRNR